MKLEIAHFEQCVVQENVTKGSSIVDNRPAVSIPTSEYNDFLFAPICEDANGMPLSLLSALVRLNVDPWEEGTRLAAMPSAIAKSTLVSTLDLIPGNSWSPSELALIAARLVRLLPQQGEGATYAAKKTGRVGAQQSNYWLVWLGFAVAMSFFSQHHHATTTGVGNSASISTATSQSKSRGANSTLPDGSGLPD